MLQYLMQHLEALNYAGSNYYACTKEEVIPVLKRLNRLVISYA